MEYKMLDINEVELDINNPRIKQWLKFIRMKNLPVKQFQLALSAQPEAHLPLHIQHLENLFE